MTNARRAISPSGCVISVTERRSNPDSWRSSR
jgi:hypothetical protein